MADAQPVAAPRRGRYGFFLLAASSVLMISVDGGIVAVALPSLIRDLDTSLAWGGWVLNASALAATIAMPLVGKLSEQFGRMRVFGACLLLFTLGSLLCGVAPNVYALIAFRVLQALGGGGFMPTAVGIVARDFPENRTRMVGLFASIYPLGGIIGPNLGGVIVQQFSWREVFLVNVPLGLLALLAVARTLRAPEPFSSRSIDLTGAALFAGTMVLMLLPLTFLGRDASFWRHPAFALMLVGSAICLWLFARQELRTPEPILDPELIARHPFLVVNVYSFLFGAVIFGSLPFVPYFAVVQYGMSPLESGLVLTPRSVLMIAVSAVASFMLLRYGYRLPMFLGLLLVSLALFLLSFGWQDLAPLGFVIGPFWIMVVEMAVGGIGMGLAMPASNNASLDLLPHRAAVITGLRGMFRSIGAMIGTGLIVLTLELSTDPAEGLRAVFAVLAVLLVGTSLLAFAMPDGARDRRTAGTAEVAEGAPPRGALARRQT